MSPEKPFLLFAGEHYYPQGGWEDWRGRFETLDEAKAAFIAWQLADSGYGTPDLEIIARSQP